MQFTCLYLTKNNKIKLDPMGAQKLRIKMHFQFSFEKKRNKKQVILGGA